MSKQPDLGRLAAPYPQRHPRSVGNRGRRSNDRRKNFSRYGSAWKVPTTTLLPLPGAKGSILNRSSMRMCRRPWSETRTHFVGAVDSILDICLSTELCARTPGGFAVSPLPLADGYVTCARGVLPTHAPAALQLWKAFPSARSPV